MTGFRGMDTEGGHALADALSAASRRLGELGNQLVAASAAAAWEGPDAERFRSRVGELSAGTLRADAASLQRLADQVRGETDEQDIVSAREGTEHGPAVGPDALLPAADDMDRGYLHEDNPWLPDEFEDPLEQTFSLSAHVVSADLGRGADSAAAQLAGWGAYLGWNTDGFDQAGRDAHAFADSLTDLVTGERVPTIAELTSGGLLMGTSTGIGIFEAVTGTDCAWGDDRTEVTVLHAEHTGPSASARDLAGLIADNDEARREMFGNRGADAFDPSRATQIRVQEVTSVGGAEPSYIVQVPPTQGGVDNPDAWGAQGNPFGWDANPALVAGQETASMNAVRAAMDEAQVPAGANVMFVGHSQGGIVAAHLAADASFNNTSGRSGSYHVTHSFSVGSPTQTVVPAQTSTEVVNVAHGPLTLGRSRSKGDPIPTLDLGGRQLTGGHVSGPNLHEVQLPARENATTGNGTLPFVEDNHESVVRDSGGAIVPDAGYYGSLRSAEHTDPTLVALTDELDGVYLGEGTAITHETVVQVGRKDLR